jgi:hypothetical protein
LSPVLSASRQEQLQNQEMIMGLTRLKGMNVNGLLILVICLSVLLGSPSQASAESEFVTNKKLSEQGNVAAQNNLGDMYFNGRGVPNDDKKAVAWYRKAAEQGHAIAQFNLGFMYEIGEGVPRDDKQAAAWYQKAAEQGVAAAQNCLGRLYLDGRGVPQDGKKAVAWYRKAAEQGHAIAQENLGFMYGTGKGVPQNDVKAYVWSSLAAAQGIENAAKNRDISAKGFTPEQRSKAQSLSAELQDKIDKKMK